MLWLEKGGSRWLGGVSRCRWSSAGHPGRGASGRGGPRKEEAREDHSGGEFGVGGLQTRERIMQIVLPGERGKRKGLWVKRAYVHSAGNALSFSHAVSLGLLSLCEISLHCAGDPSPRGAANSHRRGKAGRVPYKRREWWWICRSNSCSHLATPRHPRPPLRRSRAPQPCSAVLTWPRAKGPPALRHLVGRDRLSLPFVSVCPPYVREDTLVSGADREPGGCGGGPTFL
ncbi:hypothetical protein SKAU_G00134890 [Synaphobranchus kaupii]|uniref:Uncharacterized protein n=1 Tax=Synaphobranchus kaupii TaxID=118154 RepID=A0A9Q1FS53_SYNKA|nr:hypothetical protein SKAU_G00134890 [Synaphobranchus kaupii]